MPAAINAYFHPHKIIMAVLKKLQIKAPTLILWGDQDKAVDISSVPVFEKGLKNHKTVIIKDCGHMPIIEKPQEAATHYIDFIKSIKN